MTSIVLKRIKGLGGASVVICFLLCVSSVSGGEAREPYFPVKNKRGEPGLDRFLTSWFGESLYRMEEPRLTHMATNEAAVAYRFTISPTWGNTVSVRIQNEGKVFKLFAKRLDGRGGYELGKLIERKEFVLPERQSAEIFACLESLNFFATTTLKSDGGCDGEYWVLEGVQNGKYHVVARWSADFEAEKRGLTAFVKFCSLLVDCTSLKEGPKNKGHELFPPPGSVAR
jgi:hypothetical protein